MPAITSVDVTVHLTADDLAEALRRDARAGLTSAPKDLPPKWLYDDRGCQLFDQITRLPGYYPTRAERRILADRAGEISRLTRADTLVELGSGTSDKTRILLDALRSQGTLARFAPFDVAEPTLRAAAEAIAAEYAPVTVEGVVGDFDHHLCHLPTGGRRLVAFLGGTIGNLHPEGRARLLGELAGGMAGDDRLLVGTDLVKDRRRLVAAYDDPEGVTAAFNLNLLAVLNRELGASFDLDRFTHVARFDEEARNMEMLLRAGPAHTVEVRGLGLEVGFEAGEEMRTEISAKFTPEGVASELGAAGLELEAWWTDPAGDFGLALARP